MELKTFSLLTAIGGTTITLLIYSYLYSRYHEKWVKVWIVAWIVHAIRLVFFDLSADIHDGSDSLLLLYECCVIAESLFLVWGIYQLLDKPIPRFATKMITVIVLFTSIGIVAHWPFLIKSALAVAFIGTIYCAVGIVFIKNILLEGWGKYITGVSFLLLGVHTFDLPFFIVDPQFIPIGYLIDAFLRFLIAIGTLTIYFEKNQAILQQQEEYYRLFTENAIDVIYRYNLKPQEYLEYISPSVFKLIAYYPEELYKLPNFFEEVIYHPDIPQFQRFFNELITNHTNKDYFIVRLMGKNSFPVWVEQSFSVIRNQHGEIVAIEGIIRDITQRRNLENEILKLDRLNVIGQMAANLAHEVRNPMTIIRGYLQLLCNKTEFERYREQIELAISEADRTNSIISDYLSLCRDKVSDLKPAYLNQIVSTLYPLMQASALADNHQIELKLGKEYAILMDEKEIRQLILNVVRNGLDAMPRPGVITISTYYDQHGMHLQITDQGTGIPAEILDQLGTPFVTTKDKGTGLGLPVCYCIAERHQAKFEIHTSNQGTMISICFPQ